MPFMSLPAKVLAILALIVSLAVIPSGVAVAEPDMSAAVEALAEGSFSDKIKAVEALAATGDPRVVPALEAMLNRQLYVRKSDNKVFIGEPQGKAIILKDPLTLAELEQVGKRDVKKVRVNNRLRGTIRAAMGGLTLLSPDEDVRAAAAEAVFKAPSPAARPLLLQAIARESDDGIREKLELAKAAIDLTSSSEQAPRLEALETLSGATSQDVRALVASVLVTNPDGSPSEADADVRAAAEEALERIEGRLELWGIAENVFQGLSLGSVLLLAAVGLAITFGVMGVINMAHGEMVMLGAYTTFVVQEIIRTHAAHLFDYSLFVAIPAAFIVAGAIGIIIERTIIRYLYGRPLETLLATWGLSLILQQTVRTIFGPTNREVGNPSWMSGAVEVTGGLTLTYNRIWIIVFSLLVLGLLMLLMRKTPLGLQIRAVTQNRRMAASMGIRTGAIDAMTFGLGSGIAGMAGVALSQIDNVSPNLGQAYIIDSFMVVVFGGVGNLWGTLVGAFSLGLVNKFLEPYAGAVLGKIIVLIAIILFIQKRPRGLFALKGRAVEA